MYNEHTSFYAKWRNSFRLSIIKTSTKQPLLKCSKKRESGSSLNVQLKPAAHMRKELKKKMPRGAVCSDVSPRVWRNFDEKFTSRSREENIKHVWYILPCEANSSSFLAEPDSSITQWNCVAYSREFRVSTGRHLELSILVNSFFTYGAGFTDSIVASLLVKA